MWKRHRAASKGQNRSMKSSQRTLSITRHDDQRRQLSSRSFRILFCGLVSGLSALSLSHFSRMRMSLGVAVKSHPPSGSGGSLDALPTIHLIGERHSGTNWLHDHLKECFGSQTRVLDKVSRFKHWFQDENIHPAKEASSHNMHVVAQFRNPYIWVEQLRKAPYYMPLHRDLDWKTFVTRPYAMPRYGKDLDVVSPRHIRSPIDMACTDESFTYQELIPCHKERYLEEQEYPFYELRHDKSGFPYASVVALRADKIKNFLEVERYKYVKSFHSVRSEDLMETGTESLIRELEKQTGMNATCEPIQMTEQLNTVDGGQLAPEFVSWMSKHVDWDAEALIGYKESDMLTANASVTANEQSHGAVSTSDSIPKKQNTIHLLGERHSGTNWMFDHLKDCFGNQTEVKDRVSRFKHWFQVENEAKLEPHGSDMHIVAQFRNPYSWVEALRQVPHHMPEHTGLDWHTFVTKQYTMPRFGRDLEVGTEGPCEFQDGYTWDEVIPCHRVMSEAFDPIYELNHDKSGSPYSSVIDLRADKIKNFLEVKDYDRVKSFRAVRYEKMVEGGTESLIRELEEATGLKAHCDPFPSAELKKRALDKDYVEWIKEHMDWDTERIVGYSPDDIPLPQTSVFDVFQLARSAVGV
mmetsp:Transcript_38756/g.57638  ORF Transcript_38756/g.57638 Transcript_38756/m.57638 type:complete len:637 (-) Transcript_38756:345-2255(-)|eukprot:CAMPEP_0194045378 /NCGR_PEP_ID=MMETSP0009_2-20130614/16731_1 /TAXON_ID=210454 /ORGANISM="Grammatophora oceanica, Strain CCMP 410" /LENGTH=636 /DNA_ID=CAMNT_0038690219 /DNA_START=37 /DNA_END=1947 /DNA_ORIENTATION=+